MRFLVLLGLICLFACSEFLQSCEPEYKKCELQTDDTYLKAYNDILNEVITQHTYHRYLGKDEEAIFKRYTKDISDSDAIDRDVIKLHNKLFGDTSRLCTIYLDTTLAPAFNPWSYYKKDTNQFSQRIVDWVNKFSDNGQAVIDSLNINQTKYSPQDFQLCIAKIKSARELPLDKPKCYIGKIILSRLVLNKAKDNGLLYYEFTCGGLCGYGRLIMVERNKSFWSIKELLTIWIS